jgi:hypothetical protein
MKRILGIIGMGLIVILLSVIWWYRVLIPGFPFNSIPDASLKEKPTMIYGSKLDTPANPSGQLPLNNDTQLDDFFQSWLEKNQSGWTTDYNTYVGGITISTGRSRLIVFLDHKFATFAYPVFKNADSQIVKALTPEDVAAFKAQFDRLGIKTDLANGQ